MTVILGAGGGSSVPNWQLLQTSTPTGVATVTLSGLSGYSKYRILMASSLCTVSTTQLRLQMNGDSSVSNYTYGWTSYVGATIAGNANSGLGSIILGSLHNSNPSSYQIDIEHALLATSKFLSGSSQNYGSIGVHVPAYSGWYVTTAALTSITLYLSSNNFSSGRIELLGAN